MKDATRFKANLTALGELYGKEVTRTLLDLYWIALSEFSDEEIERGISEGVKRWRCFGRLPSPAEFIEVIRGDTSGQALAAWEQLQRGVSLAGTYQSVQFEDPRIARVVKILGGWETVCQWPMSEIQFRRHEFLEAYKSLPDGGAPAVLAGLCDRLNGAVGYCAQEPVRIAKTGLLPPVASAMPPEPELSPGTAGEDGGQQIPIREVMRQLDGKLFQGGKHGDKN